MPNAETLRERFATPPPAQRPMLRWWWPGGAVDLPELVQQLRSFHSAGFGGVEIQPLRIGLPHNMPAETAARVHEVFTPAYFKLLNSVMTEAAELGLCVDLNFGSCWPFGGGTAITPELAALELTLAWTTVEGGQLWQGRPNQPQRPLRAGTYAERHGMTDPAQALPAGWPERMAARERVVAVLALRGGVPSTGPYAGFVPMTLPDRWGDVIASGYVDAQATIDLTDHLQPDGTLAWEAPAGQWQIVVLKQFVLDQTLMEAAGHGPQLVASHLDAAAFAAHAQRVGSAGLPFLQKHIGSTWRAVFVDSLEIPADLHWCDDFEAEFAQRRGYALRPFLPLLLQPGWRNCFQPRHGAPLFDDPAVGPRVREDYRQTVSELMLERCYRPFTAWAEAHGLQSRTQAHGAPADWLAVYGSASIPETEDLAGGGGAHFQRVARSAAHIYGRELVSGEAFTFLLEGLAVTPAQLRERAEVFYANGIQQLVGHGASAKLAGLNANGEANQAWYPFNAMEIGTQLDNANPLWGAMRPLADFMARCQVVMQHGRAVVPVAVLAPLDLFALNGAGERLTAPPWHSALEAAGYDWDWINAEGLMNSRMEGGELVTPGGHHYSALLQPGMQSPLRADVAEHITALILAGLTVASLDRVAPSQMGRHLRAAGVPTSIDLPADHGLAFQVRDSRDERWLFLRNPAAQAKTLHLPLPAGCAAELWHGWSGEQEALPLDAQNHAKVKLPASGSRIVRIAPAAGSLPTQTPRALPPHAFERAVTGPWSLQAQGLGLNGRPIAFEDAAFSLQDLSQRADVADFAGQLNYTFRIELDATELAQGPLWLDLGRVADTAQVSVNGSAAATAPEAPFVFDIHSALRVGTNTLRVTVFNRPENARRDPARPGGLPIPGRRLSRLPTGLLGPVRLFTANAPATRWRITSAEGTA
jgi:hypothetical protein